MQTLISSHYTGFDFELIDSRYGWSTGELYMYRQANVNLSPFLNCDTIPFIPNSALIKLTIEPEIEGVSLYNWETRDTVGWSHTVGINETSNYYVALLPDYYSNEERIIKVTASYNSYHKSDTLRILPRYYSLLTEPARVYMNWLYKSVDVFGFLGDWEEPLPDTIQYNLEILNDNRLIDVVLRSSGEIGKVFKNIPHDYGCFGFEVIPTSEKPLNDDTLKIRISTTDPGINPAEVEVIYPAQRMLVEFSPKTIMPGDTADVLLKKIEENGSLSNFPQDQLFDFRIIGGEHYGTIFVPEYGDTTDEGWYVQQGFKFIASTPIENLPVESVLMVKTSEGFAGSKLEGDGSVKEKYKRFNEFHLNKTNQLQKSNIAEAYKTNKGDVSKSIMKSSSEEQLWGIGKLIIGGGSDCSNALQCEGEAEVPTVEINPIYKNGDFGVDSCNSSIKPYGLFLPLTGDNNSRNTFEDYEIDVCYNNVKDKWQAQIIGNKLKIRAIKDICLDNLLRDNNRIIYNINQIQQEIKNKEEAWAAFVKFFNHLSYPVITDFLILDFIINHEKIHMNQYIKYAIPLATHPEKGFYFNNRTYKDFEELFSDFGPSCMESPNIELAKSQVREYFDKIINLLRKELKDTYKWGGTWANESNINSFISQKKIILQYQEELIRLFPEIKEHIQFADYYVKGI